MSRIDKILPSREEVDELLDKKLSGLTKSEALEAMKEGKKVSREYFSPDEYIYINMDTRLIQSEDGFNFTEWWSNIEPTIGKTSERCWRIWLK